MWQGKGGQICWFLIIFIFNSYLQLHQGGPGQVVIEEPGQKGVRGQWSAVKEGAMGEGGDRRWKIGSRFCSPKAPPPCQKPAHTCRRTSICPSQESALKLVDTSISQKGFQSGCQILLIKKSKFNHLLSVHPFPLDVRRVVAEAGSRLEGGQIARRTSPPCLSFSIWVIFLHSLIFLHLDHLAPQNTITKKTWENSSRSGIEILVKRYLEGETENLSRE